MSLHTHIALLRGINVSGQKLIPMDELRRHFGSAGGSDVRTYIQSGNVIFNHPEKSPAKLRRSLESHLSDKLGCTLQVIVKSRQEFDEIAAGNPFDARVPEFGKRMYVCFFEMAPSADAVSRIQPRISDEEKLVVKGSAGYAYYAAGLGRAKLSSAVIERFLGLATMRNWNTVTALRKLCGESQAAGKS